MKKQTNDTQKSRIIMGIDPGTNKMGYGVISVCGGEARYITMGYISIPSTLPTYKKLEVIFSRVDEIMSTYCPSEVAYEAPFFGKNIQSMLKLGRAQGVAMAAAIKHGATIFEYAPRKIKIAITGKGGASKEQVANLLKAILKLEELPKNLDSTDGLAVALCHHYQENNQSFTGTKKSWEDYVKSNPEKVKK
ncbi:MAG: crossover junction endodeoxyribonuclease RuvC [Rikenellaceae bacterium]